jgi:S-DNA-T family DNA segregation ATPase FtsK/SpoIIIE
VLRKLPGPLQIFVGDALMDPALAARAGGPAAVAGVRGSDVSDGSPEFAGAFQAYAKSRGIRYTPKAARAYDAAAALLEAYRLAAEPKGGPEILEALARVRFEGKSGPVAFDDNGDLVVARGAKLYDVVEFGPAGSVAKAAAPVAPEASGIAGAAATAGPATAAAPAAGAAAPALAPVRGAPPVVGAAAAATPGAATVVAAAPGVGVPPPGATVTVPAAESAAAAVLGVGVPPPGATVTAPDAAPAPPPDPSAAARRHPRPPRRLQ